jgi:beta-glucanase (GH16 family)
MITISKITSIILLFLALSFTATAQYSLVWSDEFNGNALDGAKWAYEIGDGCPNLCGWGNNESQYYTSSPNNVKVDTGYLHIIAKEEQYQGSNYTSGRIKTQGRYDFQYGKIEARIKMPVGQGIWPAFWMLGTNITAVSWPQCGEIDIMEHINSAPDIHGTIHYNLNSSYNFIGQSTTCDVTQFQLYTVEWDEDDIKWFVNGTLFHQVNITNGMNSTEEFHNPFFLLLNLAVGGNWPGGPNASTPSTSTMLVDYVRVYQKPTVNTPNIIDFDANDNWGTYMNVYETPANGGGYLFGSSWALQDAKATLDLNVGAAGSLTLQPNFNTHLNSSSDPYWVNQSTGLGNKELEASTFVEPGSTYLGSDFTFTGNVVSYTLDSTQYEAKVFVKALDPANGYSDVLNNSKVFDIPPSGSFSITVDSASLASGLLIQYGFSIRGINANPVNEVALGSIVIGAMNSNTPINQIQEQPSVVSIYPNPANDVLTISTDKNIEAFKILDLRGVVVLEGNNAEVINVSNLIAGTYFVEFIFSDGKETDSFIKR